MALKSLQLFSRSEIPEAQNAGVVSRKCLPAAGQECHAKDLTGDVDLFHDFLRLHIPQPKLAGCRFGHARKSVTAVRRDRRRENYSRMPVKTSELLSSFYVPNA